MYIWAYLPISTLSEYIYINLSLYLNFHDILKFVNSPQNRHFKVLVTNPRTPTVHTYPTKTYSGSFTTLLFTLKTNLPTGMFTLTSLCFVVKFHLKKIRFSRVYFFKELYRDDTFWNLFLALISEYLAFS